MKLWTGICPFPSALLTYYAHSTMVVVDEIDIWKHALCEQLRRPAAALTLSPNTHLERTMTRKATRWSMTMLSVALSASSVALGQGLPTRTDTVIVRLEPVPFPALVGDPAFVAGGPSGFAMVDYSNMTIFHTSGSGAWTDSLTARGAGPGEFRQISGVAFDARGRIWVADRANGRLTQLTPNLRVLRSITTSIPLQSLSPNADGSQFIAIPSAVKDLAVLVGADGGLQRRIAFATQEESVNPILRERFLIRVSDSLAIIQFRWFNRRIGLRMDGSVAFSEGDRSKMPEVVAMRLNQAGTSMGYRIASGAVPFASSIAVFGDQLLVLRGSSDDNADGRIISVFDARSGVLRRTLRLPLAVVKLASNGQQLLAIAETNEGYAMYRVILPK